MSIDAAAAALRALSFIALFQAVGVALFLMLFGQLLHATAATLDRVARGSAALALLLLAVQYLLEAGRLSGDFGGILDLSLQRFVLHSATAAAFGLRIVALVLILLALARHATSRLANGRPGNVQRILVVFGVLLTIGSFTLVGHTSHHPLRWLLGVLLLVHLLVVAFWFGALVPLATVARREAAALATAVTEAFSLLALRLVPLLLVTGLVMAGTLLGGLSGLRSAYGKLLLVKLAGFALLMVLAALNRLRLGRALGTETGIVAFRRSVVAEYVLIAGVLAVTATMTTFYSPE